MAESNQTVSRMAYWDMVKGITILLMVLGHVKGLPQNIRIIIFSFHMPLFIIANGYFIKNYDVKRTLKRSINTLIVPYVVLCFISAVIYMFIGRADIGAWGRFLVKMKAMIGGVSFTSTRFTGFQSVMMVWFICSLFITRNLYVFIMSRLKTCSVGIIWLVMILISFIGCYIGTQYAFLPWSLDVALSTIIFITVGNYINKTQLFEKDLRIIIIVSGIIWLFFLSKGMNIELAVRKYPGGVLCYIEAIAGSIFVIAMMKTLSGLKYLNQFLSWAGKHSMMILCLHTLESVYFDWNRYVYSHIPFELNWMHIFLIRCSAILIFLAILMLLKRGIIYLKNRMAK